jgi:hypothetical protein
VSLANGKDGRWEERTPRTSKRHMPRHMPTLPEKTNPSVTGLRLPTGGPQTSLARAPQPQSGESPGGKETVEVVLPEAISTGPKDGSTSGATKATPSAGRPPTPTVRRSSSMPGHLLAAARSVRAQGGRSGTHRRAAPPGRYRICLRQIESHTESPRPLRRSPTDYVRREICVRSSISLTAKS